MARIVNGHKIEPKADLSRADLSEVDLSGVDLSKANLEGRRRQQELELQVFRRSCSSCGRPVSAYGLCGCS